MMKLYPINISDLSYLESGQFIVRFLTDYTASGLNPETDPDFKALHQDLINQSPIFNDSLMQIRVKAETDELATLDEVRDKKLTVLHRALSVFEHADEANEKSAYNLVKIVMNTYKGIAEANYESESLAVDNLIAELRNSTHSSALETLGLQIHVTNLEVSNTNFKNKFNSRSTATISQVVYDTKMLRKEILATYKDLAEYVLVMAKRRNTAYYIDTLAVINNGRQSFATLAARHHSTPKEKTPTNS